MASATESAVGALPTVEELMRRIVSQETSLIELRKCTKRALKRMEADITRVTQVSKRDIESMVQAEVASQCKPIQRQVDALQSRFDHLKLMCHRIETQVQQAFTGLPSQSDLNTLKEWRPEVDRRLNEMRVDTEALRPFKSYASYAPYLSGLENVATLTEDMEQVKLDLHTLSLRDIEISQDLGNFEQSIRDSIFKLQHSLLIVNKALGYRRV